ncbi:MAG TPA: kelch repeat-containing protein [Thermoanaerobaculia bacterium]|nr:kelch repeat-containing protein [Thermoanaerobaculia bacterium]
MTRNRIVFFLTSAALLLAPALFATTPTARTGTHMVYDPKTTYTVLFGGQSPFDPGTAKAYNLNDTWYWVGDHWVQVYPATTPAGRSFHTMTYDVAHSRITMFGGKTDASTAVDETWAYDGIDWTQLHPSAAPSPRIWAGSAYDTTRNRIVLYGGQFTTSDLKTTTNYYDTWEFDGINWSQIGSNGPQITTPLVAYYEPTHQMIMLGSDSTQKPHMYSLNAANGTWTEMTPSTMPDCVNDAGLVYQAHDPKVLVLYAGTCSSSGTGSNTYEWDGSNWQLVGPPSGTFRLTGEAMAYDPARRTTTIFGGTEAFSVPLAQTLTYNDGVWSNPRDPAYSPSPRSLFAFNTDPLNGVIWLIGGMDATATLDDIWKYSRGSWQEVPFANSPIACVSPVSAFDSHRNKLVVVCQDVSVHEFDGTTWTNVDTTGQKTHPQVRRFSSMVFDEHLNKVVLFGGYNDINYLNETWTWDGTTWAQVNHNNAPARSHAAMWYDPNMKLTVMYGGIGQRSSQDRIERFQDMWSFDGTGWTEMTVTTTPGQRYGAQVTVNPVDGKAYLFGGLKLTVDGAKQSQNYENDLWVWDGSAKTWSQVNTSTIPPARENGGLAFDPITRELVLVAGYAGYYRSDAWSFRGGDWVLHPEGIQQPRRRGVGH